jgi:hypothetical protein
MLVQPAPELLNQLKNYQSASELIRAAIASPTPENENSAWEAVLPIVDKLRDFYEYAAELGKEKCYQYPDWLCAGNSSPQILPFPYLVLSLKADHFLLHQRIVSPNCSACFAPVM